MSVFLQHFHHDEGLAVALVDFIDGADVGMIKSGCGTGLATKSFQSLEIVRYFFGQELQGHEAPKSGVLCLIHNPHPTATELLDDAVVRDGLADHGKQCYGGVVGKSMKAGELAVSQKDDWRNIAITLIDPAGAHLRMVGFDIIPRGAGRYRPAGREQIVAEAVDDSGYLLRCAAIIMSKR